MQYEYVLEKAYAMAYLPADKMEACTTLLTRLVDHLAPHIPEPLCNKLQGFTTYLRTFWLPLGDVLSAYMRPIKTNNTCENFHLHATKDVGVRQILYKMLGNNLFLNHVTVLFFYAFISDRLKGTQHF